MAILKVARLGHPILREVSRELTREEILSPPTQKLTLDLVHTQVAE